LGGGGGVAAERARENSENLRLGFADPLTVTRRLGRTNPRSHQLIRVYLALRGHEGPEGTTLPIVRSYFVITTLSSLAIGRKAGEKKTLLPTVK
jgi:hypothetical protein